MRGKLGALMIPLLLLAACAGKGGDEAEQMALDMRAKYLSMTGCTATVAMIADYGERVFPCKVALDYTAGGDTLLTLLEPEILNGVTARLTDGEGLLEFDGVSLDTGPLSPEGLSPMDCIPFLLKEIREGFLSQWSVEPLMETDCLRVTASDPEGEPGQGTETTLWFEKETFALIRGELSVDGRAVLICDITDFQWKN